MTLAKACSCALVLLFLGSMTAAAAQARTPHTVSTKNCVRLVGGDIGPYGPRGRLEVSTKDPEFPGMSGDGVSRPPSNIWVPVCQGISDDTAQVMCEIMGYKYGRTYYAPELVYPTKPSNTPPAMSLTCAPKSAETAETGAVDEVGGVVPNSGHRRHRHRRHLSQVVATSAEAASSEDRLVATHGADRVQDRSLAIAFYNYSVAFPRNVPYTCTFDRGSFCWRKGPYAGVECSNQPFPPAPPPPPAPPSADVYKSSIRIIGGDHSDTGRPVERNLCPESAPERFCQVFARVEVLVPPAAPEGNASATNISSVWAPLCATESPELRQVIADIACQQEHGWPSELRPRPGYIVSGFAPSEAPFSYPVPQGEVTGTSLFDPAAFTSWVTISSLADKAPSMLQDGDLTVSSTPCSELFAVNCVLLGLGHRHQHRLRHQ